MRLWLVDTVKRIQDTSEKTEKKKKCRNNHCECGLITAKQSEYFNWQVTADKILEID